ncbi:MAG: B12-binding domain-containing radical SAM protein, partial [Acidobacteria bacterium]|nr:B12-binding domain-containing radical SAM protein [Acidobacteriota bacterium]
LELIRATLDQDGKERIVGMTVMPGQQLQSAIRDTISLKTSHPDCFIVWGGYFPSEHREVVLRSGLVDAVVRGQGEITLLELREALRRGKSLHGIAGLSFVEGEETVHNPPRGLTDVNRFPPYPYEAIDPRRYLVPTNLGARTLSHNASVGCYERCNFCSITTLYNARWIPERVERVLDQVTRFKDDCGADGLEFFDAHFFPSEKRSLAIAEGLAPLSISWWGQSRVDSLLAYRDETLRRLRASGLGMIFFGAESGSDLVLSKMDKNQTSEQILALVRRLRAFDIVPELSFILGAPEDPGRDIEASIDFVRRVKREYPASEIILFLYTPFPQPGLYDDAVEAGFSFPRDLLDWTEEPWRSFGLKSPGAPWLSESLRRRVLDFDLVVHSRFPSATDIRLTSRMRSALEILGSWRYRFRFYSHPYELKLLHRLVSYRAPELEGA